MRRKLSFLVQLVLTIGLIPAHAGKTPSKPRAISQPGTHPRSRGENNRTKLIQSCSTGSSPLMRGKQIHCLQTPPCPRLIPAHAGKTPTAPTASSRDSAHPRSRGENSLDLREVSLVPGSSPLTRGKRRGGQAGRRRRRLIPAHAGKTYASSLARALSAAHPHSRGENRDGVLKSMSIGGSSPLTRGKPDRLHEADDYGRLISAHAGKTCSWPGQSPRKTAHPRSRGENPVVSLDLHHAAGSSPLTRGKPRSSPSSSSPRRLIPAHAGKTYPRMTVVSGVSAHPRSRGENTCARRRQTRICGSSPLTRGKRDHAGRGPVLVRLIPAHAGKTRS